MKYFPINNPTSGSEQRIYYNAEDDKRELLEKHILSYWEDYCNSHWIWLGKFEDGKWNYEDKVKYFLNRCANFLLMGEYQRSNLMSGKDISRIHANELSLEGDWQNESLEIELEETVDFLSNHIKSNYSIEDKILETDFDNKPSKPKRRRKSKTTKIFNICSEDEKELIDYKKIHISNTFNVWKKGTKKTPARKGLIDKKKPYISEWCTVDTENVFMFQGDKYKISEDVKQYKTRTKKPKYDDYKLDYQMDRILVYKQNDNLVYFDQNIDQIENNKVIEV